MKKRKVWIIALAVLLLVLCVCISQSEEVKKITGDESQSELALEEKAEKKTPDKKELKTLKFVDAYGKSYDMQVNSQIRPNTYENKSFVRNGSRMSYGGEDYSYRLGIDVSHYQGDIDWKKVKASGIEFVMIRLGFRGYGAEGVLKVDTNFEKNIKGARAAGLDVGVYFYAQAINEKEAVEEAEFVLENLANYSLQMPVVYDPESVLHEEARTDHVTAEQFTKNAKAFCETIEDAGYEPMIYCNMLWQAFKLDLKELSDYPIWYADYEMYPQTPYHFEIWQYSSEGTVDGIQGNVDLNMHMIKE